MDQRKFRRAIADFARVGDVLPDSRAAEERARWCLAHEGDVEDKPAAVDGAAVPDPPAGKR